MELEIKRMLIALSAYYGQKFDDHVISMYAEDLADIPIDELKQTLLEIRRDPKITRFPLPAQIRAKTSNAIDSESRARECISRINTAVKRHGYMNSGAARDEIGPEGWRVVQANGGWMSICESDFISNPGLQAQARQRAKDLIEHGGALLELGSSLSTERTGKLLPFTLKSIE